MKIRIKKFFNMVEIALALAVVGVGIAGTMALFPVGFNSIRDAMAESYGADAMEEFLNQISREAKNNWNLYIGTNFTESPPTISDSQTDTYKQSELISGSGIWITTLGNNIYALEKGTGSITDFKAHVKVWKGKIQNLNVAGQTFNDIPYDYGAVIYAEISWPVEKPYSKREKRIYFKEVFRGM